MTETQEPNFTVEYLVPMECESCVDTVKQSIQALPNVHSVEVNYPSEHVIVTGTEAPSHVVSSLRDAGLDAIVRGSGTPNSAAVCILTSKDHTTSGLVRIIDAGNCAYFDVSVSAKLDKARICIKASGDLSNHAHSMGDTLFELGTVRLKNGNGSAIFSKDIATASIVGRGITAGPLDGEPTLAGVVARSAGLWENEKMVCSCSGQTVWHERELYKGRF